MSCSRHACTALPKGISSIITAICSQWHQPLLQQGRPGCARNEYLFLWSVMPWLLTETLVDFQTQYLSMNIRERVISLPIAFTLFSEIWIPPPSLCFLFSISTSHSCLVYTLQTQPIPQHLRLINTTWQISYLTQNKSWPFHFSLIISSHFIELALSFVCVCMCLVRIKMFFINSVMCVLIVIISVEILIHLSFPTYLISFSQLVAQINF